MTEDEKKEFEEFLEWKAEKKRQEEETSVKQEEEERQVKANIQMPMQKGYFPTQYFCCDL